MIHVEHNAEDLRTKIESVTEFIGHGFTVGLELSDRSITILYYQAKNHGRDATEAIGDIEEGEIEQCFEEGFEAVQIRPGMSQEARHDAAEKLGDLLRRYLVAGIDDEDLIDTGELRDDARTCSLRFEGI